MMHHDNFLVPQQFIQYVLNVKKKLEQFQTDETTRMNFLSKSSDKSCKFDFSGNSVKLINGDGMKPHIYVEGDTTQFNANMVILDVPQGIFSQLEWDKKAWDYDKFKNILQNIYAWNTCQNPIYVIFLHEEPVSGHYAS